ncbi:hypothetical protein [Pseudosulfitobacter pseudonitzschiae]|uniref:hypothetical protein n=1 Tax=Pseudosulfitobacter pseudonitzschiae TaxID=1402135 RepID=UPI003B7854FD
MTDKTEKPNSASGLEDTRMLGKAADANIKLQRPQVADKAKLAGAISSIDDLSERLARLDSQDGPFGTGGARSEAKLFDGLLRDIEETPMHGSDKGAVEEVLPTGTVEDDGTLISSLIEDQETSPEEDDLSDLDAFFGEARMDPEIDEPEAPVQTLPHPINDYKSALDEIINDVDQGDVLDIMDEDIHDPIDDMLDDSSLIGEDDEKSLEHVQQVGIEEDGNHASPFAALFNRVELEFEDRGAGEISDAEARIDIEEYDPDEDLFFGEDEDAEVSDTPNFTGVLQGANPDTSVRSYDINSSLRDEVVDPGENDDSDAISLLNDTQEDPTYSDGSGLSDLPELTMGQDNDLYAPGTSYRDEDENPEAMWDDAEEVSEDPEANESLFEKEEKMTISINASDRNEDARDEGVHDEEDFTSSDLDDLLGDDDDDESSDDIDNGSVSDVDEDSPQSDGSGENDPASILFDDDVDQVETSEEDVMDEFREDAASTLATPPAEGKKSKTAALALVSVSFLAIAGIGGYAYVNGMLPPIPGLSPALPSAPVQVAVGDQGRNMDPVPRVEDVDMSEIGTTQDDDADNGSALNEGAGNSSDILALADEIDTMPDVEIAGTVDTLDPVINDGTDVPDVIENAEVSDSATEDDIPAPEGDIVEGGDSSIESDTTDVDVADLASDMVDADPENNRLPIDDFHTALDISTADDRVSTGDDPVESEDDMTIVTNDPDVTEQSVEDMVDPDSENNSESDITVTAEEPLPEGDAVENPDVLISDVENASSVPEMTSDDTTEETPDDGELPDTGLIGLAEVLQDAELREIADQNDTPDADVAAPDAGMVDPLAELAAEIDAAEQGANDAEEVPSVIIDDSSFVEEERVIEIENSVASLDESLASMSEEMKKLNQLIIRSLEKDSEITKRIEVNEQSLRVTSSILAEMTSMKESLDQTQVVLLDIAARVGMLESANPADRQEVGDQLREMEGEIRKLSANMSIIARMTVNGVTALTAKGASSGEDGVRTSISRQPGAGNDIVFSDGETEPAVPTEPNIPSNVRKNDYVEGYGYVLDVVPASGNQKLVVMENGSALIPE